MKKLMYHFTTLVGLTLLAGCSESNLPQLPIRDAALEDAVLNDQNPLDMMVEEDMEATQVDASSPMDFGMADDDQYRFQCGALTYPKVSETDSEAIDWSFEGLTELGNGFSGSCGGLGSESVVAFKVPRDGTYTVMLTSERGSSPVLHVRSTCDSLVTEVACSATESASERAVVSFEAVAGDTRYLFADTWQPSPPTGFALRVFYANSPLPPIIEDLQGAAIEGATSVKVTLSDQNADLKAVRFFSDAEPSVEPLELVLDESVLGERQITTTLTPNFALADASWSAVVIDVTGLESAAVPIERSELFQLSADDACGADQEMLSICPLQHTCSERLDGARKCTSSAAPTLGDIRVVRTKNAFVILGVINDPNADASLGLIDFYDDAGALAEQRAFPIAMRGPEFALSVSLSATLGLNIATANFKVLDDFGNETSVFEIPITEQEIISRGSICDPHNPLEVCEENFGCLNPCDFRGSPACVNRFQCESLIRPQLSEAIVTENELRQVLTLSLTIQDPQRIFGQVAVENAVIRFSQQNFDWQRIDDTTLTLHQRAPLSSATENAGSLLLTPYDKWGGSGETEEVLITPPREVEAGAGCDPDDAAVRCPIGFACYATSDAPPACRLSTAPQLTQGSIFVEANQAYTGAYLVGAAGDADVNLMRIRTRSNDPDSAFEEQFRYQLTVEAERNEAFEIRSLLPSEVFTQQNLTFEVAVTDRRYLTSEWVSVTAELPPELSENDACYQSTIFGKCEDGTYCQLASNAAFGICLQGTTACPEEWTVETLSEAGSDYTRFSGDTRSAFADTVGNCNAQGTATMHAFVPASTSYYVARVRGVGDYPLQFPRIAALSSCTRDETTLGCSNSSAAIFLADESQQSVYLSVSSAPLGLDLDGTYEMNVYRHQPASILSLSLSDSTQANRVTMAIEVQSGTEALTAVGLRVLDSQGQPIWSVVNGETWNQGLLVAASGTINPIEIDISSYLDTDAQTLEVTIVDELGGKSDPRVLDLQLP